MQEIPRSPYVLTANECRTTKENLLELAFDAMQVRVAVTQPTSCFGFPVLNLFRCQGDLLSLEPMSQCESFHMMYQILSGIEHIHRHGGRVHRDITERYGENLWCFKMW